VNTGEYTEDGREQYDSSLGDALRKKITIEPGVLCCAVGQDGTTGQDRRKGAVAARSRQELVRFSNPEGTEKN
jgi:hypothetical protein